VLCVVFSVVLCCVVLSCVVLCCVVLCECVECVCVYIFPWKVPGHFLPWTSEFDYLLCALRKFPGHLLGNHTHSASLLPTRARETQENPGSQSKRRCANPRLTQGLPVFVQVRPSQRLKVL